MSQPARRRNNHEVFEGDHEPIVSFADYYNASIISREQFRDKNQEYLKQLEYLEGRLVEINAELEG